jgi:hypothetical protein
MSWGVALRNSVSLGLGGIVSLFSGSSGNSPSTGALLTEASDFLVQENGFKILA